MVVSLILDLKGIHKENIPNLEGMRCNDQNNKFNITITLLAGFQSCMKDPNTERKQDFFNSK